AAAVGPVAGTVLLRRPDLARRRLRAAPDARRGPGQPADGRLLRGPRLATAGPHRHRRRELRPPPPPRPHGPGLRPGAHRPRPDRPPDQLRRVPGAAPPHPRGRYLREHLVELRPRRRALALRLRL